MTRRAPRYGALLASLALGASLAPEARAARGAQVLGYELGARPAALGGAYTAVGDAATALSWNPAGLARNQGDDVTIAQSRWLEGFRLLHASYSGPLARELGGALAVTHVDYGDFEGLDNTGSPTGTFGASDLAAAAGVGFSPAENLDVGAAVKGFRQTLETETAVGGAVDAGVLLRRGRLRFGGSIQNLGPPIKFRDDPTGLPLALRAGVAWDVRADALLAADVVEIPHAERSLRVGGEYRAPEYRGVRAALRIGYRLEPGLLGLAYGVGIETARARLEVSVVPMGDFGFAQWLSLSWRFTLPRRSPRATLSPLLPGPGEMSPRRLYAEALDWYAREGRKLPLEARREVLSRLIDRYRPLGLDVAELERELQELSDER